MVDDLIELRQKSITDFLVVSGDQNQNGTNSIGYKRLHFERCAVKMCHPFRAVMQCRNKSLCNIKETMSTLCSSKLQSCHLSFANNRLRLDREFCNAGGITSMAFDKEGVLLAVCGSSGSVRIFNFDDCVAASHSRTAANIAPVEGFDVRREISHVCWNPNPRREDELAIAFAFAPQIHVYDLQETDLSSPTCALETGSTRGGEGGNNILLYWSTAHQRIARNNPKGEYPSTIISGGSRGYLRSWHAEKSKCKKCLWSILADPVSAAQNAAPVVGLLVLADGASLLAATASGVLVLWDIAHLTMGTLGSSAAPTCLHRLLTADQMLMPFPAVQLQSVAFFAGQHLHGAEVVLLTLSSGEVHLFDLDTAQLVLPVHFVPTASDPLPLAAYQTPSLMKPQVMRCSSALPAWPGGNVCIQSLDNCLKILDLDSSRAAAAVKRSSNVVVLLAEESGLDRHVLDIHSMRSHLRRGLEASHTLPGRVMSAETGCYRITTTQDLQWYLCAEGAAHSSTSRSHELVLDWSMAERTSDAHTLNDGFWTEGVDRCAVVLDSVSAFAFVLREQYSGPTVVNGQPVVHLRTNLTPRGFSHNASGNQAVYWPERRTLPLPFMCTQLVCHPSLSYVVAGGSDEGLHLLHPHTSPDETPSEVESGGESALDIELREERLTKGNHVNVWRWRYGHNRCSDGVDCSSALVSISKFSSNSSSNLNVENEMSGELVRDLEEACRESVASLLADEERRRQSSSGSSNDWLDEIVRDVRGDEQEEVEEMTYGDDCGEFSECGRAEFESTSVDQLVGDSIACDAQCAAGEEGVAAPLCIEDLLSGIDSSFLHSGTGRGKENHQPSSRSADRPAVIDLFGCAEETTAKAAPAICSIFKAAPKSNKPSSTITSLWSADASKASVAMKTDKLKQAQDVLKRKHTLNSLSSKIAVDIATGNSSNNSGPGVTQSSKRLDTGKSRQPTKSSFASTASQSGTQSRAPAVSFNSVMGERASIFGGGRSSGALSNSSSKLGAASNNSNSSLLSALSSAPKNVRNNHFVAGSTTSGALRPFGLGGSGNKTAEMGKFLSATKK